MPRPKSNRETESIRRLIDARLQRQGLDETGLGRAAAGAHLDEDALSVFVEGRLSERESAPFIKHLVACGSCRRITAQLIRLNDELNVSSEAAIERPQVEDEPGRFRRFLADLAARVLPSSDDDAVFAYHAPAEDFQRQADADSNRETESAQKDEASAREDGEPASPSH